MPEITLTLALPHQGGGNLFLYFNVFALSPGGRGEGEGVLWPPANHENPPSPPFNKGGLGGFEKILLLLLPF